MSIIFVLIPIAIVFVIIAVCLFMWAVRNDQFDDLERHGHSVLFEDEPVNPRSSDSVNKQQEVADE